MKTETSNLHAALPDGFAYADEIQSATFAATGYVPGARKVCLVRADEQTIADERDLLQAGGPDEFPTGYYEHLAEQNTARLAVVLGPPKHDRAITRRPLMRLSIKVAVRHGEIKNPEDGAEVLAWYIAQYNAGYAAGRRPYSAAFDRGTTSHAWDDGYLDAAAGRPKWHLTHCTDHDNCGEA